MRIVAIIFFTFFLQKISIAQPYYFTHYQVENGLSNNAVMCSLQDHNGFMWFGTRDGLNRFDGYSFKVFRNIPEISSSIGSNAITCLAEDDQHTLWVGTERGLYQLNERTEKFEQLSTAGNVSIRNLRVHGNGLWYISLYTLYRYDLRSGIVKQFKIDKEVTSYCFTRDKTLWVATSAGTIGKYNNGTDDFTEYDLFDRKPHTVSKWIESLYDTGNDILLVGTLNEGLKSFHIKSHAIKDLLTKNNDNTGIIVRDIIGNNAGEYWIASQSGIYILDIKTGRVKNLSRDPNNPYTLSDNIVHTLCRDREGGIWAGTYFGGINYYPRQYVSFRKYFPVTGKNSISGYAVREICNDEDGNIWIGTEDAGLNKLDASTGKFTNFNTGHGNNSITFSNIHGLLVDGDEVWVGTYLHGLDVLNRKTGKKIKHFNTSNSGLGSNFIYSLFKTRNNNILTATDQGLYEYNRKTGRFSLFTQIKKVFYRALNEEEDGTIWAGTYGDGIFRFNLASGTSEQLLAEPGNSSSLPGNIINTIFKSRNGTIWVATEAGLSRYDKNSKGFHTITYKEGLPSNVVYSILEDKTGNLWVSTSKGLVEYSPSSGKIKIYTKTHGLLTDQFNYNSGFMDKQGQMYFGSAKGLITFHPDSIKKFDYAAPVFLTGFQVYNKELPIGEKGSPLQQSISFTDRMILDHSQSSFSIDFAALSYTAPNSIKYVYRMEGLDKTWTHLETNRKVYFTELDPGTYEFSVSAIESNSGLTGKPATLKIIVLPPLWQTWWAYTIYAIVILLIAYLVIREITRRSKEKHRAILERLEFQKERENYQDKIQFFTNVAHEIRTPLTLIKGPMENIMGKVDQVPAIKRSLEIMNRNTERLLHLSSQLLDFRKTEMNGFLLNLSREDISQLLADHQNNFLEAAMQRTLVLEVDIPEHFYAHVDLETFNKILSNLWDNAIKYASRWVNVELKLPQAGSSFYEIIFKNDGPVIPLEEREHIFKSFYRGKETSKLTGTGIGLTLSRSLAELHGGKLCMDQQDEAVNVFILSMPLVPVFRN